MNVSTLSAISLLPTYSADYQALSANYITSLGTFNTTDTTWPVITAANAPFTKIQVTPTLPTTAPYTTNNLQFFFTDSWDPATIVTPYSAVSATGLFHTYYHPGTYFIVLFIPTSSTPVGPFLVAEVDINEIAAKPAIKAYNLSGIEVSTNASGISPFTLNFCASSTIAGSFPIERLIWDFGDGTTTEVTRYESTTTNKITAFTDQTEPRNYTVMHTFYRNFIFDVPNFNIDLDAISMTTATSYPTTTAYAITGVNLTTTPTFRLIKSRMFGFDDSLLLVTEATDANNTVFIHKLTL